MPGHTNKNISDVAKQDKRMREQYEQENKVPQEHAIFLLYSICAPEHKNNTKVLKSF